MRRRAARKRRRRRQAMMIGIGVLALAAVGLILYFAMIRPHSKKPSETPDTSSSRNESIPIPSVSLTEPDPAALSSEEEPGTTSDTEGSKQSQTVIPQTIDPLDGVLVDSGKWDAASLPNNSIAFGCDAERDAIGRHTGLYYYETLYGKYGQYYYVHTDEKVVYLTMDEGYEAGFTPQILDTLKEKNVKAVFFITNQFLNEKPEYVRRMIDEGHIVGNHTCRHPSGGYPKYVDAHGLESFTEDLSRLHKAVYDQFGYTMKLFRFPEGESSEMTLAQVENLGYTSVFWSFTQYDFDTENQPDPVKTLAEDIDEAAPGVIFLLHACSSTNTQILGDFIDGVRARGYEFGVFPGY